MNTNSQEQSVNYCETDSICSNTTNICPDNNKKECNYTNKLNAPSGASGQVHTCNNDEAAVIKIVNDEKDLEGERTFMKHTDTRKSKYPDIKYEKWKYVAKLYPVINDNNRCKEVSNNIVMEKVIPLDVFLNLLQEKYQESEKCQEQEQETKSKPYFETETSKILQIRYVLIMKLIMALNYLHTKINYCHNDLKPANIGVKLNCKSEEILNQCDKFDKFEIKFIDMGASKKITNGPKDLFSINDTDIWYQRTPLYACPLLLEHKMNEYERDRWALACIVYEIVANNNVLMNGSNPANLIYIIMMMDVDGLIYMLGLNNEQPHFITENMIASRETFVKQIYKYTNQHIFAIRMFIFDNIFCQLMPVVERSDAYKKLNGYQSGGTNTKPTSIQKLFKEYVEAELDLARANIIKEEAVKATTEAEKVAEAAEVSEAAAAAAAEKVAEAAAAGAAEKVAEAVAAAAAVSKTVLKGTTTKDPLKQTIKYNFKMDVQELNIPRMDEYTREQLKAVALMQIVNPPKFE